MTRSPTPHALTERLEHVEPLDPPAKAVQGAVHRAIPDGAAKDALSGTWLGHALHPLLMLVPLGSWTSAVLLDWLGGKQSEPAVDRLLAIGLAGALPTVATGASDWSDTWGGARRVGLVHALSNTTAAALFAGSLRARRRGARGTGKLLALGGMGVATVAGYLGGHLSYARGIGVDETAFEALPEDWTPVADGTTLVDGVPRDVHVGDTAIMLVRTDGRVHALAARCCHRGGPLHEGEVHDGCVTCPWHGSTFRLDDGSVVRGPAAYPQPALETREQDGVVEVRARPPA
ncbi:MAG TPA: Rieske (2Fe-2S) protein [Capillimicrobium sp.]|nr:Rieske (2Fe-2S) protein [Capillimicrobium sp.]